MIMMFLLNVEMSTNRFGEKHILKRVSFKVVLFLLGEEPNVLHFMEQTHLYKKTRTISDFKTKQIIDKATSELELLQSQHQTEGDDSVQSNPLTPEEINSVMRKVVPKVRGRRYGLGTLLDEGCSSSSGTPRQIPKL
ncbi:uncharacterized protein LOC111832048 [Capsella rubella]|uniref:uncharacterized protein LOC111832048 n=1 Tax=Capsella rubella TaxID=81985 RepID=UPI000CD50D52|nr:uncharacterized protein LOC111832048 [Capsella rubella]